MNIVATCKMLYHALLEFLTGNQFNLVISTNPLSTGLLAILISRLTGSKVIIEVNGNFKEAFRYGWGGGVSPGILERMKGLVANYMIPFVLRRADKIKLVHSRQLDPLDLNFKVKTSVFPNFVPIRRFSEVEHSDGRYVLLLGYPWYLKGVDVLIKAFNLITHEFPEYRLKIVGWCPEGRDYFEALARPNPRIELRQPVLYEKVIELMSNCSLYVLASRTDSSPRVLREAMACRKPIIASNIEGISDLIRDEHTGLLFRSESVDDLATKMKLLLTNKELSKTLAENGYNFVHEYLSEARYVMQYRSMIDGVLQEDSR